MLARLLMIVVALALGPTRSFAQERVWILDQSDQEVYLVFGVPDTDDVGVSFWCTQQSGIVRFYLPESDPKLKFAKTIDLNMEVDSRIYPFKSKASFSEESGTLSLETELKASDPIFSVMESANYFAVKVGSRNHVFPLGEADLAGFLDACKKP